MKTKIIGYARVSTKGQNLDRQLGALRAENCDKIFKETATAKTVKGRPELEKAIDQLGVGDVFVIAEWDRATRSMIDGIKIIQRIADRGASIRVLDRQWLDLTTPMGKGILAFFSAMAEDERQRIVNRANDGRKAAKAQGVKFGRKPKLSEHQQQLVKERLVNGDSVRSIALDFGVARATISRLK